MIKKEDVYKIGVFNKPHGVKGELSFTFTDDIFDRVDCDYLICLLDGILVPFFIEEYRFRTDTTALVKLERVEFTKDLGPVLHVSGADLMDGTPILDIKPYIPYCDSHPDAAGGFTSTADDYLLQVQIPHCLLEKIPEKKRPHKPCSAERRAY